jgi:hypothetical protein
MDETYVRIAGRWVYVRRSDIRKLEGIITLDDVLRVYGLLEE